MKKALFFLVSTFLITACSDTSQETGAEYQGISISNDKSEIVLFADQTTDAIMVVSDVSWTASLNPPVEDFWCIPSVTQCYVPEGQTKNTLLEISMTPNNTGVTRTTNLIIDAIQSPKASLSVPVRQYGWLDITMPSPKYVNKNGYNESATFETEIEENETSVNLEFTLYSDAKLVSNDPWIKIPKESSSLSPGKHEIQLDINQNDSYERRGSVSLISGNISTDIEILQKEHTPHGTSIQTGNSNSNKEMYADQVLDSIYVVSYDSWTADLKPLEGGEWCDIDVNQSNVPAGWLSTNTIKISATPNTTGKVRSSDFCLLSAWENTTLSSRIYQFPWLNITIPAPTYISTEFPNIEVDFNMLIKANTSYAPLTLTVYSNATITSDVEWLSIPDSYKNLAPNKYGIHLPVSSNTSTNSRTAHVTITSNGVSSTVTYVQQGK